MPAWKRTTPITVIETVTDSGIPVHYPDYLGSFLTWRYQMTAPGTSWWSGIKPFVADKEYWRMNRQDVINAFYKKIGKENISGLCPQCSGADQFDISADEVTYWPIWCLCTLAEWIQKSTYKNYTVRSWFEFTTLKTYNFHRENPQETKALELIYQKTRDFAVDPKRWLILSGPVGIGKTHLLRAVATSYGPISLYMTTRDLVSRIMTEISAGRSEDGSSKGNLDELIYKVSNAPILLLDDLGAEHIKGANSFVMSQLLSIIDYRYQSPQEFPTMITTNQTETDFRSGLWERLGDRITDRAHDFLSVSASSYRQLDERRSSSGHPIC
jgi:DNA replication protein DnaC